MPINRRQFLILSAAAAAGCQPDKSGSAPPVESQQSIDAGPASKYSADGVYGEFIDDGFIVIRRGTRLFALSSYCTHERCNVATQSDNTFYCRCHGARYDANGKVTRGPAPRDLPILKISIENSGHLIVQVPVA